MLDSAPYCRRCAGAAVEYLSHRFVRNSSPENTPSLFGTIHLVQSGVSVGVEIVLHEHKYLGLRVSGSRTLQKTAVVRALRRADTLTKRWPVPGSKAASKQAVSWRT